MNRSCLTPASIGEKEPSKDEGVYAKFGVQYGVQDIMGSLTEERRMKVQEDMQEMSEEGGMCVFA